MDDGGWFSGGGGGGGGGGREGRLVAASCTIITSLWCGSRTVKETLRSPGNGPWPLDAGNSAFQVKSAPFALGRTVDTVTQGGTVYVVTTGAMETRRRGWKQPQPSAAGKRCVQWQFHLSYQSTTLGPHWSLVSSHLWFTARLTHTSLHYNPRKTFANLSFVSWPMCFSLFNFFCNEHVEFEPT